MAERIKVHGFYTDYEKGDIEGIRYLTEDLDYNEAKVFFEHAKNYGESQFEDDNERQFTLTHKSGVYTLTRRN